MFEVSIKLVLANTQNSFYKPRLLSLYMPIVRDICYLPLLGVCHILLGVCCKSQAALRCGVEFGVLDPDHQL